MSDGDVGPGPKRLNKFLTSLDVSPDDEVHKGYDIMAIESKM